MYLRFSSDPALPLKQARRFPDQFAWRLAGVYLAVQKIDRLLQHDLNSAVYELDDDREIQEAWLARQRDFIWLRPLIYSDRGSR